jgi:hypothetical protein
VVHLAGEHSVIHLSRPTWPVDRASGSQSWRWGVLLPFRRRGKKMVKRYLGCIPDLTQTRLEEGAREVAAPAASHSNGGLPVRDRAGEADSLLHDKRVLYVPEKRQGGPTARDSSWGTTVCSACSGEAVSPRSTRESIFTSRFPSPSNCCVPGSATRKPSRFCGRR